MLKLMDKKIFKFLHLSVFVYRDGTVPMGTYPILNLKVVLKMFRHSYYIKLVGLTINQLLYFVCEKQRFLCSLVRLHGCADKPARLNSGLSKPFMLADAKSTQILCEG